MLRGRLVSVCLVLVAASAVAHERPIRLRLAPIEVAPGADRMPCEYLALPNDGAMDIRRFAVRARTGLHHLLIYAYLGADRDPRYLTHGIRDEAGCAGVGPPDLHQRKGGLLGAVREGIYDLPEGYAVSILPEQPISVSTHFFNPTRRTRRAAVRVKMVPAEPGTVRHHLEPLDVVGRAFELAPHATTVHIADFIAAETMNVAMVSSHQHQRGTRATIAPVQGGVEGEPVYENRRWSEPPLRWLDPPIRLAAGDRLRIRCEWHNLTDQTLRYGESANDEMCNLNGYVFFDVDRRPEARTGIGGTLVPVGG